MAAAKKKTTAKKRRTIRAVATGEEREIPTAGFGEEHDEKIDALRAELDLLDRKADLCRARSYTVGSAFGGCTELNMRSVHGTIWAILQPVETIELIHQLAANVGCHMQLMPRQDFSSWRGWEMSKEELEHFRGINPPGVGYPAHLTQESAQQLEDGIGRRSEGDPLEVGMGKQTKASIGAKAKNKKLPN